MKKLALVLLLSLAMLASAIALPAAAAPGGKGGGGGSSGGGPTDGGSGSLGDLTGPRWPVDGAAMSPDDNVVLKWDEVLLEIIRHNPRTTGPTIASRALGVLHTAMYDAWAPYDATAVGVHYRHGQRLTGDDTVKSEAISFAAYDTLQWLFGDARFTMDDDEPASTWITRQMTDMFGYDADAPGPAGDVGRAAATAVTAYRSGDGSNQADGYDDTTNYQPINSWDDLVDPWRWQPLCVPLPDPGEPCDGEVDGTPRAIQTALSPQWGMIDGFALGDPDDRTDPTDPDSTPSLGDPAVDLYYPPGPDDPEGEAALELADSSDLTDAQKVKAEYWADGPHSEFPPGHWAFLAQAVSRKRGHTLDDDVKLFFALGNAIMDAGIGAWHAKYKYDFVRPITAIRQQYAGQTVTSWLGPYNGYGPVDGSEWMPYQHPNVVSPNFPEYVSGHSTFSAAANIVLSMCTGSDVFRAKTTIPAGDSLFESGAVPRKNVVLSWNTFTDAADEAGWSRRWGGIHFRSADVHGRAFGKVIGYASWTLASEYLDGTADQVTR
jgi:hypothetical protein